MARSFAYNFEKFIERALNEVIEALDIEDPAFQQMLDQAHKLRDKLQTAPTGGAGFDTYIADLKSLMELQEKMGDMKFRWAYLCGYRDSKLLKEYLWPEEDFS